MVCSGICKCCSHWSCMHVQKINVRNLAFLGLGSFFHSGRVQGAFNKHRTAIGAEILCIARTCRNVRRVQQQQVVRQLPGRHGLPLLLREFNICSRLVCWGYSKTQCKLCVGRIKLMRNKRLLQVAVTSRRPCFLCVKLSLLHMLVFNFASFRELKIWPLLCSSWPSWSLDGPSEAGQLLTHSSL